MPQVSDFGILRNHIFFLAYAPISRKRTLFVVGVWPFRKLFNVLFFPPLLMPGLSWYSIAKFDNNVVHFVNFLLDGKVSMLRNNLRRIFTLI